MDHLSDSHILRRLKEAVIEAREHTAIHAEYTRRFNVANVEEWREQIAAWQKDHTQVNPYQTVSQGMSCRLFTRYCTEHHAYLELSQEAVRRQLTEKDKADEARGEAYTIHTEVSASQLLMRGLALQEHQYVIILQLLAF